MTDSRIDTYIDEAEDFAKPVLTHLRALVHQACPDIEETMKWSMPFFTLHGKNLANMAAFKEHAVFGFWEALGVETPKADEAMGHFGRIASVEELPADKELLALIEKVAEMLDQPKSLKPAMKKPVKLPPMPDDFAAAIAANTAAQKTYDGFAPSHKRDYLEWVIEAKRDATRQKRMKQAVEWMAEGKDRNWKYR